MLVSALLATLVGALPAGSSTRAPDFTEITDLYVRTGSPSWDSRHWATGGARALKGRDPRDPTGWSTARGRGALTVSAEGVLSLSGPEPRLYVRPSGPVGFRDVEVTVYQRRVEDEGAAHAGIVVGLRSGFDGHTVHGRCSASTYYVRLRNDGTADFGKELEHPKTSARGSTPAPPGLPHGKWVGMKAVIFNVGARPRLELYRDLTEGRDGGRWERLSVLEDDGRWTAETSCAGQRGDEVIVQGGGTVLLRNSGVRRAEYGWISIHEIQPSRRAPH